ncbi:phasyl DNA replicon protein arp, partial [Neisseria weixii]
IEPYLKQLAAVEYNRELKPITEENYNRILSSLVSPKWAFYNRKTIVNM